MRSGSCLLLLCAVAFEVAFAQTPDVEQGVLSGRIMGSKVCRGTPPTCTLFAADPQTSPDGYGFYTHVSISHQVVTQALSGVCERSCEGPGNTGTIATWLIAAQTSAVQPGVPTNNVEVHMVFNMNVPIPVGPVAAAVPSIVQYLKNKEAADQYSDAVRNYTQQRLEQERNEVQQLKSNVSAFEAQTTAIHMDRLSAMAAAFGEIPAALRSQGAVDKFVAYRSLSASPFIARQVTYDDVTAKYAIRELKARLATQDYVGAMTVADDLYHSNHRGDLSVLPAGSVDDGVIRLEASNSTLPVSPFAGTRFSTADAATGGQELRRVANSFEAFWGESNGLVNYSDLSVNEYVVGLVFLRQADQTFLAGDNSVEAFGYLQASQTMLDVARGIRAGVADSIESIIRAVPALGRSLLKFSQFLYADTEDQYRILYDVVVSIPDVARALAKQFKTDIDVILSGSPSERARTISRITVDVLVTYFTGAAVEGVVVNRVAVVDSALTGTVTDGLVGGLAKADSFSSGAAIRAEAVAPIVQDVTVARMIETSTFKDASSTLVEYDKHGGSLAAIKDFAGLQGEEGISENGLVRYKELKNERGWRAVLRVSDKTLSKERNLPTLEIQQIGDGPVMKFRYLPENE